MLTLEPGAIRDDARVATPAAGATFGCICTGFESAGAREMLQQ